MPPDSLPPLASAAYAAHMPHFIPKDEQGSFFKIAQIALRVLSMTSFVLAAVLFASSTSILPLPAILMAVSIASGIASMIYSKASQVFTQLFQDSQPSLSPNELLATLEEALP